MRKNILILTAIFIFTLSAISCFSTRESEIAVNSKPNTANIETKQKESGQAGLEKSPEAEKSPETEPEEKRKDMKDDSPDTDDNGKIENRCGWYSNPTPGNHWIEDRDGEWIIGVQGGSQAEGDYPPEFSDAQWVNTNGNYGYGCACLRVTVNRREKQIIKVFSASARPLSACRNDPALTEPFE
jgi:hypothetical protein